MVSFLHFMFKCPIFLHYHNILMNTMVRYSLCEISTGTRLTVSCSVFVMFVYFKTGSKTTLMNLKTK